MRERQSKGRAWIRNIRRCRHSVWLAVAHQASIWTQIFVTGPFMILTCIPPLRSLKG